jgi:arylsulfatase A-like enzyme
VYQHSMYSTTCDLAAIEIPDTVEFLSGLPLLREEEHMLHHAVFSYYRNFQRMVRTSTHKLIEYPQIRRIQLFDLKRDPWEIRDLSADSTTSTLRAELAQRLNAFNRNLAILSTWIIRLPKRMTDSSPVSQLGLADRPAPVLSPLIEEDGRDRS